LKNKKCIPYNITNDNKELYIIIFLLTITILAIGIILVKVYNFLRNIRRELTNSNAS
jgi:hypothetical protein